MSAEVSNLSAPLWLRAKESLTDDVRRLEAWVDSLAVFPDETADRLWALGELDND